MPSFDIISEVNMHEVTNAIDQSSKEVATRFDFKGTDSRFEQSDSTVTLISKGEPQLKVMLDIMRKKLGKRGIDIRSLDVENPQLSGKEARQTITVKQGIDKVLAKKIIKLIKDQKLKVQASIMDEKVRVSGKKKDDLQEVMGFLREADLELPLQFENFRD